MIANLLALAGDESGGALVEYALVTALVSLTAYTALTALGTVLETFFADSSTGLAAVAQNAK